MRSERGFTIAELMMSMAISLVVLTAVLGLVQVVTKNQQRVSDRVAANQRARPVMTRLIDELHSGCVAAGVAPVSVGSTSSAISFISKSGAAVSPTPDLHVVALEGTSLTEQVFPPTGGAPPTWTFSNTASSSRTLMTGVTAPSGSQVFQYFAFNGGQIAVTPLPTPLSATDAARTVKVNASFAVAPSSSGPSAFDTKSPITLSDSASLRLEPASEDASEVNLPCV
ncbi:MAG: prepilin-type N-terminal cleavage/methylation domain-containing protein [Solirubrobacterales bacterium]|nr:prepilin-type N-terminal cleavage/methylation domain-containing protein [Solirubrobacterales bacterium]